MALTIEKLAQGMQVRIARVGVLRRAATAVIPLSSSTSFDATPGRALRRSDLTESRIDERVNIN